MPSLIRNHDGCLVATRLEIANTYLSRLQGLLGRREMNPDCAIWLSPCRSVHTFGMRFSIDILFMDTELRIIKLLPRTSADSLCWAPRGTRSIVELAEGRIRQLNLQVEDQLVIRI